MYDLNEDNFKPNHLLSAHMDHVGGGVGHNKRSSGWGWVGVAVSAMAVIFFAARMIS